MGRRNAEQQLRGTVIDCHSTGPLRTRSLIRRPGFRKSGLASVYTRARRPPNLKCAAATVEGRRVSRSRGRKVVMKPRAHCAGATSVGSAVTMPSVALPKDEVLE